MSVAGIGNAAVGALVATVLGSVFTNESSKPATKGDIIALANKIKRYQKVINLPFRNNGTRPYCDMETKQIVYFMSGRLPV